MVDDEEDWVVNDVEYALEDVSTVGDILIIFVDGRIVDVPFTFFVEKRRDVGTVDWESGAGVPDVIVDDSGLSVAVISTEVASCVLELGVVVFFSEIDADVEYRLEKLRAVGNVLIFWVDG